MKQQRVHLLVSGKVQGVFFRQALKVVAKKNNVLVLEFDKYGILAKKEFYNKKKMKKISFAKNVTENEIRKENFIQGFLSSVRQKMEQRKR